MSKAGKRGKSAQGAAAGAKWEQGLLAAVFEEVIFCFIFRVWRKLQFIRYSTKCSEIIPVLIVSTSRRCRYVYMALRLYVYLVWKYRNWGGGGGGGGKLSFS